MSTRISIPDGGSIAVVAPSLLNPTFWNIDATSIVSRFPVRAITHVLVFPRGPNARMHDVTDLDEAPKFTFAPKREPIESVALETGMGTIRLGIDGQKLQVTLEPIQAVAAKRDCHFHKWDRNQTLQDGDEAIEYRLPNVSINKVILNDALSFERRGNKARVDVFFDPAELDPFKRGREQGR